MESESSSSYSSGEKRLTIYQQIDELKARVTQLELYLEQLTAEFDSEEGEYSGLGADFDCVGE